VTRDECIGTSFYTLIPESWHDTVRQKIDSLTPDLPVTSGQHR